MNNSAETVITLYSIMMMLMTAIIPIAIICVLTSWIVRIAKRSYNKALK